MYLSDVHIIILNRILLKCLSRLRWYGFIGTAILVATAFMYHRPSERLLGQSDQASYAISAIALAQGHGSAPQKAMLDSLPQAIADSVVVVQAPLGLRDGSSKLRQRSFYLNWQTGSLHRGELVARFPVGYPVLLAVGFRLAGWSGLLAINVILMTVAGLLVMFLAAKWAGPLAGLCAAALWASFPVNVWLSNVTLAEPLVAMLGLTALVAWACSVTSRRIAWPILLGACVGISPAVKLDALPWLLLPILYAWANRKNGLWNAAIPSIATLPGLIVSVYVLLAADSGYAAESMRTLFSQPIVRGGIVLLFVVLCGAVALAWRHRSRSSQMRQNNTEQHSSMPEGAGARICRWIFFAGTVAVLGFFYFIRSRWAGADQIYWMPLGRVVPSLREVSLVRLGWYFSPIGLGVAALSAAAAAIWAKEAWMRAFGVIGMAVLLLLSYDHLNFPMEPFATRRFLPQAIPLLIIALAGASKWFWPKLATWGRWSTGLVVVFTVGYGISVNGKMNSRSDAEGLLASIHFIAETVGPEAIIVMRPSGPLMEIAPLLAFGFRRDVVPFRINDNAERVAVQNWLAQQEQAGRTIWLWSYSEDDALGLKGQVLQSSPLREISVPLLKMSTTEQPFEWGKRVWKFSLRRISFVTAARPIPMKE